MEDSPGAASASRSCSPRGAVELGFHVYLGFEAIPQVQTLQDIERLICESREKYAARAS
ncbi:hypothetical protein [Amycolatopsis sp. NPDC051128]|uniref:hypothetical protein n=1 Tax=Amycolatopsis sp. NPDC051128 TaxID=3155412 RepID=UPI003442C39F